MNTVNQEALMLESGKYGDNLDLPSLIEDGIISLEGANLYLKKIGSSAKISINDNVKDDK